MTSYIKKNNFLFVTYLGGLSILGFLSTDMYLPAFDTMQKDLDVPKSFIGYTLSLFLAGYSISQLVWGPIAARVGNIQAILLGLAVFALASVGIYFTSNITFLLILRLIQALGVCAAAVCWQALVIEHYPPSETDGVLASIMPLVALSPALAPVLGAYLLTHVGWRIIFIVLTAIALLLMAYSFHLSRIFKVSAPKTPPKKGIANKNYWSFLRSKKYLGNVMIYAFCSAAFFAWLTGSPFFLKELGYSESVIGLSFVPQTITFMIGGYAYKFLAHKIDGKKLLPILLIIYSLSLLLILIIYLTTEPNLVNLLIPFCFMALTNGATYPIAVAQALKVFSQHSAKAAALQNTIQLGMCFLASGLVALFTQNALLATSLVMVGTIPFVFFAYRWTLNHS